MIAIAYLVVLCACGPHSRTTGGTSATSTSSLQTQGIAPMPPRAAPTTVPAGTDAIAVSGMNDGAALRGELSLLRATTLKPVVQHPMSDSSFLGVIGDRAYIDDWCCNGRGDTYQPATIYSVSLKDGSESQHTDLAPDPEAHPANLQPLGQGAQNYLISKYFYVVVGPVTYRYDVDYLQRPPKRMATPTMP